VPRVKVDGTFVHFPDGTSPEYIEAVLRNGFQNFRSDLTTAAQHLKGLAEQSVIIGSISNMRPEDMAAMIPGGVGDVLGPYADYTDIRDNWQERDWTQNAAAGIGAALGALPFVPSRSQVNAVGDVVKEKITAYHGSPHDFDRFSMSQIGTGEGAQAYGHGLYFAESEDVARGYRDALQKGSGATDDDVMARAIQAHDGDLEAAAKSLGERGNRLMESDPDKAQRFYQMQMRVMGGHNPSGHMYQVEIDASPDEFLDWDKPLSEQSEAVRKALGYSDNPNLDPKKKAYVDDFLKYDSMTEQDLYESLTFSNDYVKGMSPEDANVLVEYAKANRVRGDEMVTPEFAERARQAGIKGIRYKDGFSRGAEGGTSNYVVFDENIISIAKKYGLAIPAAAALYGNMTGQDTGGLYAEDT
jgi:hypothetical protein